MQRQLFVLYGLGGVGKTQIVVQLRGSIRTLSAPSSSLMDFNSLYQGQTAVL
jgi:hypothetical protein